MRIKTQLVYFFGISAILGGIFVTAGVRAETPSSSETTIVAQKTADDFFNEGLVKLQEQDYAAAINSFGEVIRLNPNDAMAYLARALAYRNQGDYQQAISDYDQSLRLEPENAQAYLGRGICKHYLNDNRGAISDYTATLRYNAESGQAYYNRGLSHMDLGQKQEALADFRKAAELYGQQNLTEYRQDALNRIEEIEG